MDNSQIATQIFNTLTALGLKQAQGLRQLTQSEKSLLELSEARGGLMLKNSEAYICGEIEPHKLPSQKVIFEIEPPEDSEVECEICGGGDECEPGCPNEDEEDT